MLKIYDCSNSVKRPAHRGGGGPIENDVVKQLKKWAAHFNATFVDSPFGADILFTNDVYPDEILALGLPKVKRMDGMFYRPYDKTRNDIYNTAALQSDHVVFISEYAKDSFERLYGYPITASVSLNVAEPEIFQFRPRPVCSHRYVAACTDWSREEKRLSAIVQLADSDAFNGDIYLVGHIHIEVPENVKVLGYLDQPRMAELFYNMDAFINFSYRDPSPKVVCQALATGLPVFYAASGGAHESVLDCGYGVPDPEYALFEEQAPYLHIDGDDWRTFEHLIPEYQNSLSKRDFNREFMTMLETYYNVFKALV